MAGHAQVHEGHAGVSGGGAFEGLDPIGGLGHDLDVGFGVDDRAKALADDRMVVGDQDADHLLLAAG